MIAVGTPGPQLQDHDRSTTGPHQQAPDRSGRDLNSKRQIAVSPPPNKLEETLALVEAEGYLENT